MKGKFFVGAAAISHCAACSRASPLQKETGSSCNSPFLQSIIQRLDCTEKKIGLLQLGTDIWQPFCSHLWLGRNCPASKEEGWLRSAEEAAALLLCACLQDKKERDPDGSCLPNKTQNILVPGCSGSYQHPFEVLEISRNYN